MTDELQCQVALPDASIPSGTTLQTKSLFSGLESFTITRDRRLLHHKKQWHTAMADGAAVPLMTSTALCDVGAQCHGDIRFGAHNAQANTSNSSDASRTTFWNGSSRTRR